MGKPRSVSTNFVKTEMEETEMEERESAGAKPAGTKSEKAKPAKERTEKAKTVVRRQIFSGFQGQLKSTPKEAIAAAVLSAIGNSIIRPTR